MCIKRSRVCTGAQAVNVSFIFHLYRFLHRSNENDPLGLDTGPLLVSCSSSCLDFGSWSLHEGHFCNYMFLELLLSWFAACSCIILQASCVTGMHQSLGDFVSGSTFHYNDLINVNHFSCQWFHVVAKWCMPLNLLYLRSSADMVRSVGMIKSSSSRTGNVWFCTHYQECTVESGTH